jgi:hypothetical protein
MLIIDYVFEMAATEIRPIVPGAYSGTFDEPIVY